MYSKNKCSRNECSKEPKTALVRPIFKKNEKNKIGNYRLVTPIAFLLKEPKTALVRPIFKKNEKNKIGNYRLVTPIAFLLMLKRYYQISYQLLKNPIVQIMTF